MNIPIVFLLLGSGGPWYNLAILDNVEIGPEPIGVHAGECN